MKRLKAALAALALIAALALPSLQWVRGETLAGWSFQPAVVQACDPGTGSGCGG